MSNSLHQLGSLTLEGLLGSNGIFHTYRGIHMGRRTPMLLVAVAEGHISDPAVWQVFEHDLRALLDGGGPRLCQPIECGREASHYWAAYEWLDGMHLGQLTRDHGLPSYEQAFSWMSQLAESLAALHRRGVAHRCISPASIFITEKSEVKLLHSCWSLLLLYTTEGLASPAMASVLPFVAPEILAGQTGDESADVYSLGANLYFLLSGQPVFWSEDPAMLAHAAVNEPVNMEALPPEIPQEARDLVEELLSKNPEERPINLPALSDRLRNLARSMAGRDSHSGKDSSPRLSQMHINLQHMREGTTPAPPKSRVSTQVPQPDPGWQEQWKPPAAATATPAIDVATGHPALPDIDPPDPPAVQRRRMIIIGVSAAVLLASVGIFAMTLMGGGNKPDVPRGDAPKDDTPAVAEGPAATPAAGTTPPPTAVPTLRAPDPALVQKYVEATRAVTNLGRIMIIYKKQRGLGENDWPRDVKDLSKLAKPEEFKDPWGNEMYISASFVVSMGADGKADTFDDVWYDAAKQAPGGYSPTLDAPR